MKYLLGGICAMLLSMTAFAADSQQEYNFKIATQDGWEFTHRQREGNWHAEVGNKVGSHRGYVPLC